MPSPIFDAMNSRPPQLDIIQQYNSFRQDPFTFLLKTKGIDIPQQYRNDPQGAVTYLLNSGQMSQEQLAYIKSMAQRYGFNI